MSAGIATGNWWNSSLAEVGVQAMDRTLPADAGWNDICQSGREELTEAIRVSGLAVGPERRVLDLGCGVGRVAAALAECCGDVVGVDISASLIASAQQNLARPNLQFRHVTGSPLEPQIEGRFDTVFSNEVYYYLPMSVLTGYSHDAHRLLKDGGEYVFQLNLEPIGVRTRLSWRMRTLLYSCGIKKWRGWSNSPGFTRYCHSVEQVRAMLESIGFTVERVAAGRSLRQTWFVARKAVSAD